MGNLSDETIINQIAQHERAIAGVRNSFDFAKNPDSLTAAMLPAVIHYSPVFTAEPRSHHNVWKNSVTAQSLLMVAPRESQGGKLKFIENSALPFGNLWRVRFQTDSVITSLLSTAGAVRFFLTEGRYGAGGPLLTYGAVEYIGWVFTFSVDSA